MLLSMTNRLNRRLDSDHISITWLATGAFDLSGVWRVIVALLKISVPATVLHLATAKHSTSVRVDLFLRGLQCGFSS